MSNQRVDFGNWIRWRLVLVFYAVAVAIAGAGMFLEAPLRLALFALTALPLGTAVYLTWLAAAFSDRGGGMQRRLWRLVLDELRWDGRGVALDVGTGQGALAIGLAERFPGARVIGADLWGADWAYSQEACERNARVAGVDGRTRFVQASASSLPFESGEMDAVVSHFVFHEVKDVDDPRLVIREALRVLKPGGAFCFQDMFLDERLYGDVDDLLATLRGWGLREVRFSRLSDRLSIPAGMRGRRVLGAAALIAGVK